MLLGNSDDDDWYYWALANYGFVIPCAFLWAVAPYYVYIHFKATVQYSRVAHFYLVSFGASIESYKFKILLLLWMLMLQLLLWMLMLLLLSLLLLSCFI